ncbi:MAG: bifunctional diaminohydroxyphosphoribosylaminopyrimidine deaminase/5-amino-6-(5-phosphoribosylamino)uracil reductase RibD [Corynebacterium sp.]|nr:bifunctional diaminohydroxyphosphoribosylaminopyrimidine deaminase/5-amino-6-(5-phosphoribosylamino)uracil reductase RibD [Corynebacterium sp.]
MTTPWGGFNGWNPWIDEANQLAARVYGTTYPNPAVGAVILDKDGLRIGEGMTQTPPGPHAEVVAIQSVKDKSRLEGATIIVTLEPCNHYGKTPPCAKAIIESGIKRVVYAQSDPNNIAKGGARTLAAAGVEAIFVVHETPQLTNWLNLLRTGRPKVRAKIAQSLDGLIAAPDGTSQWITSQESRNHAHKLRARTGAVVVGANTYEIDKPKLTARNADGSLRDHQPERIVVGSRKLDLESGVHQVADFDELFALCSELGLYDILLEGGAGLITTALKADIVDELDVYAAPLILGSGTRAIGDLGITTLADGLSWEPIDYQQLGPDFYTRLQRIESE